MTVKVFTTGLIVLLVAIVGSIIGGVCVCAYFYQEGRKKRQIRPEAQPVARMVEPFDTKKLWERGKKKPVTLTNGDGANSRTDSEFGVNPSVIDCSPPPPLQLEPAPPQLEPPTPQSEPPPRQSEPPPPRYSALSAKAPAHTTAVEIS